MANLCELLDQEEKKELYLQRAEEGKKALIEKCWDEESRFFYSIHALTDQKLPGLTISGLFPLALDIDTQKLDRLVKDHLMNEEEFWLPYPIPTVAKSSPAFNPKGGTQLWRGPTWVSPNWYIVKGLQSNGYEDIAQEIITKMIEMVNISGFREQYDPFTAKGYGAKNFGWSTLLIDLL
jgi:glycogen debranching enzyme